MLSDYRYRSVLNVFHEVYLFCYRVFYCGTSKPKDSSLIVTEKKALNKIFFSVRLTEGATRNSALSFKLVFLNKFSM